MTAHHLLITRQQQLQRLFTSTHFTSTHADTVTSMSVLVTTQLSDVIDDSNEHDTIHRLNESTVGADASVPWHVMVTAECKLSTGPDTL